MSNDTVKWAVRRVRVQTSRLRETRSFEATGQKERVSLSCLLSVSSRKITDNPVLWSYPKPPCTFIVDT